MKTIAIILKAPLFLNLQTNPMDRVIEWQKEAKIYLQMKEDGIGHKINCHQRAGVNKSITQILQIT